MTRAGRSVKALGLAGTVDRLPLPDTRRAGVAAVALAVEVLLLGAACGGSHAAAKLGIEGPPVLGAKNSP